LAQALLPGKRCTFSLVVKTVSMEEEVVVAVAAIPEETVEEPVMFARPLMMLLQELS
jgi:hypothetical protein